VHKVKGNRNWLLVDLLREKVFQVTPDEDIETLKKQLLEYKLAHETNGIIPFKYQLNVIREYRSERRIRSLQIRITGECNADCEDCGFCNCFRGKGKITDDIIDRLIEQVKNLPVEQLMISGGNPFLEKDKVEWIFNSIKADKYIVVFKGKIDPDWKRFLSEKGVEVMGNFRDLIPFEKTMKADAFTFFYQEHFNPCWGNSLSIDIDGSIKPCLWSKYVIGNIKNQTIAELIDMGAFDQYWEISKDEIEICKECEYRYSCNIDCRVMASKETGGLYSKNPRCKYNPTIGEWKT
jgi:radical SAM protein with 4Fe4S-binding SPASM domain